MAVANQQPIRAEGELNSLLRFYGLAKTQEWQVGDLPWSDLPYVPEVRLGASDRRKALQREIWDSVVMQQLQADDHAVTMATQLYGAAPDLEAKQYYATMVQDEARHSEAWLRLVKETGGDADRNPHLDELVGIFLDADTLEEKIFLMQVFFERLIIPKFIMISAAAGGTVLAALCDKLKVDDGIHHGSGVAYEGILLKDASPALKKRVVKTAEQALPHFRAHALWRPSARIAISSTMQARDMLQLNKDIEWGRRKGTELGLDFSEV